MGVDAPLVLRLFAVPSLELAGVPLRFPSRKGIALLILLALAGQQSRDKLANWLWMDSANPKDALRNALAQVNKVLTAAGLAPLQANRQTVAWIDSRLVVDAQQLEREISAAQLLALRGSWLEGFVLADAPEFDSWAGQQGAFYTGLLQGQLERGAERLAVSARLEEALLLAGQRLRLDALNESAYRQLMRLQRSAGREAEARQTLLLCRTTLRRELGIAPSAATLAVLNEPAPSLSTLEDAPFGRQAERTWLGALRQTKGLGLLLGEAGAGKTALLKAEFPQAIWLECRPNDAALPFSSVLRTVRKRLRESLELPAWVLSALARFLPELGRTPEAFDQLRVYAAFDLFFPSMGTLLVDDLHFIDELSAAWLWQLVQQRRDDPEAATVLAYRPDQLGDASQIAVSQLERQGAVVRRVQPLTPSDAAMWLERLGIPAMLAADFIGVTGGNALFFKEAALAYRATGDFRGGLLPLLQTRLASLTPLEWRLTQFVAVAGSLATLQLATQVLGSDQLELAATWARLEDLEVLAGSSFAHDLLCDAALASTPATIQAALAGAMLGHLEQRLHLGERFPSSVLAQLAQRSSDPRREAHYRLLTALEVYQLGSMRVGIGHLERCLELLEVQPLLPSLGDLELLYLKLTPIYRADVYNAPNLQNALRQLLHVARQRGVRKLEAIALATQADWLAQTKRDFKRARAVFDQAAELAGQDAQVRYLIFDLRSWAENSAGQTHLALEYAVQSLTFAGDDLSLRFRALEAVYMFEQNLSRWEPAKSHALEAANAAHDSGQMRHGRPYALTMAAYCALLLGDLKTCEQHIVLALQLLEQSQWHNALGFATRVHAQLLLERDDLSGALDRAEESVVHYQQLVNPLALCSSLSTLARVHLAAGRLPACAEGIAAAEGALAQLVDLPNANVTQSSLDNLRCSVQAGLGLDALPSAMRAIQGRIDPPEAIGALLLVPREDELRALHTAGHAALAQTELERFLHLHPSNPRAQLLHLRARMVLEPDRLERLREQAHALALELGMVMQARVIQTLE